MSSSNELKGDDPTIYDTTYIVGALSTKTHFHIYEDCHHVVELDSREASVNAIRYHELALCPECKRRKLTKTTTRTRSSEHVFKTSVYLTDEEYSAVLTMVDKNIIKGKSTVINLALREYHRTFGSKTKAITAQVGERDSTKEISVRLPIADKKLAKRRVDQGVYETRNQMYRAAVRQYMCQLNELPNKKGWEYPTISAGPKSIDGVSKKEAPRTTNIESVEGDE
jgi:uncharacterized protein YlaI/Arc/MetJ-type ribon-helix-helix transcriptional regulator